jgi:hypothetical protein
MPILVIDDPGIVRSICPVAVSGHAHQRSIGQKLPSRPQMNLTRLGHRMEFINVKTAARQTIVPALKGFPTARRQFPIADAIQLGCGMVRVHHRNHPR